MRPKDVSALSAIAMAMLLLASTGCSSKVKFTSRSLCENAGGRYVQGTCEPGKTMKAGDMCEAHGGVYLAGEDNCIIFEK